MPTPFSLPSLANINIISLICGLDASKGTPTAIGALFLATDTKKIYISYDGSTWSAVLDIVVAAYSTTGNTGAVTNAINYTPPASARRYKISGLVNVISWTTPATFTVVVTYKDDSGNARTETLQVIRGSTGAAAAAITAVDRWYFELPLLAIDASAVAITVSTTGTFTGTPTYNLSAVLELVA